MDSTNHIRLADWFFILGFFMALGATGHTGLTAFTAQVIIGTGLMYMGRKV